MENLAYAVAIVFVLHFCWSYYWTCYRKGYTMDLWHFGLLNTLVVIHVMLPFSRGNLNAIALGPAGWLRAQSFITEAYFISALGYAGILLGGFLWRVNLGIHTRKSVARLFELPAKGPMILLQSKELLMAQGSVALLLLLGVLFYYFSLSGFGFNLRGLLLVNPGFRPIAQFTAFYSVLIGSLCLARWSVRKERSLLLISSGILVGLLFFGERGNLVGLVSLTVLTGFLKLGRRLKPIWFLLGISGVLVGMVMMSSLRESNFSLENTGARFAMEVFYGNSFSDTRDFALVLSYWDGHYFYGLTYLAGLLAFIPRALSDFRDTWSLGVVTATMAGYSKTEHPGLRPGSFGEAFLNFGLPGVLLVGVIAGAAGRFVDLRMKQALALLPPRSLKVFSYSILGAFIGPLQISSGASAAYSVLMVFMFSWCFLGVIRFLKLEQPGI